LLRNAETYDLQELQLFMEGKP